jgi:two-component system LytT family response regulator
MIRAVIAEDEPLARQTVREFIEETDWVVLEGEAENGLEAVRLVNKLEPDLLFLDVQMPELSGLQVLERISHTPAIVFTTAYDRYAVAAFEVEAVDYLVKPFGRKRFHATLNRVRKRIQEGDSEAGRRAHDALRDGPLRRLFARKGQTIVPIVVDCITRIEAGDSYVNVFTPDGRFLLHVTLNELEARLDTERFQRVHRSHIVNLDCVAAMEPYDDRRLVLTLCDGSRVVASRAGSQALRGLVS